MRALADRHIVVTGASAGIGAALCRALAPRKVRLVLAARRIDRLDALAAELRAAGSEVLCVACDVSRRAAVLELAAQARARFGEIDVWVNNAGRGTRHRVLEASEQDMLELYGLNCLSSLYAYQAVIPLWLADRESAVGRQIIDVCSIAGKSGYAYNAGYAAAKHAMSAVADALRLELNGSGIYVTTVYPGRTVSDFSDSVVDRTGGDMSTRTSGSASGRFGWLARRVASVQTAEHLARAIVRVMERPRSRVFPHGWGNLATLVYNLLPELALRLAGKPYRRD